MTTDQAVRQFSAAPGNEIRWVAFESNMQDLPASGNDIMLVPCHCYFYADHFEEKMALTHRRSDAQAGTYELSSNYFNGMGGTDSHIDVPTGQWRDRWLGTADGFVAEGLVDDGNEDVQRLGEAFDPPKETIEHVDFMSEVQYEGSMDLPAVEEGDNRAILSWVGTTDGVMRPADALPNVGGQQGEYAKIQKYDDAWGRYWLYFWLEP